MVYGKVYPFVGLEFKKYVQDLKIHCTSFRVFAPEPFFILCIFNHIDYVIEEFL
ncbi:hypothetical protein DJ93_3489 [Bacillus clarus]|uniref:Uncharacterized protein n=1 Tax=Bacillus clarus TaxID=2338372 RepID=A0A090YJX0_9BACI|nr:hypothetical protein DJ93_3489 [Bacillus clarus]